MTPRYERGAALRIAGLKRGHVAGKAAETTRRQWIELVGRGPIAGQRSQIAYGVFCDDDGHPDRDRFEYLTGVEINPSGQLDAGVDALDLAETAYAVFTYEGHVRDMRRLWPRILAEWLPADRLAPGPRFERYDARFDPVMATGVVEIWIPVTRA